MKRLTIADLARVSGVSISTVNRILSGAGGVRPETIKLVQDRAAEINFYGRGVLESRGKVAMREYRFGFLLQQQSRELYRVIGENLEQAAYRQTQVRIKPRTKFVDNLSPDNIAENLLELGKHCDALAVITADHPMIGQAIHDLRQQGKPVVTYITDLSVADRAAHVGTNNWKLGRTAAWFIAKTSPQIGRVALFIGSHRYQCQDIADASFRSYMREHAHYLVLEETRPTNEEPEQAYLMVKDLLIQAPNLVGIFIGGGGISGVLRALREESADQRRQVTVVCRDIGPETRKGLSEGLITAALTLPPKDAADELIKAMINAVTTKSSELIHQHILPFQIITPESY